MSHPNDKLVVDGCWGKVIYASRPKGSRHAEDYYLSRGTPDRAKLNALFKWVADAGKIFNRTKFKQVEDDIFEFKSGSMRISCYQSERIWYLLHGFSKSSDKWPKGEVIRARNLLIEHRGY